MRDTVISRFVILGSGGGGRTVASIIHARFSVPGQPGPEIAFLDDVDKRTAVNGYPVVGFVSRALDETWPEGTGFIVAFGALNLSARERIFRLLLAKGRQIFNAIHPAAYIDHWAIIGKGNVITANCVIHPNAVLGNNCFLCAASTIDHDDQLGNNVYLSPGVHLAGGVTVGDNVFIGTGASVLPGVHIGRGAIVGAGAVVIRDVAEGSKVFGVPAELG